MKQILLKKIQKYFLLLTIIALPFMNLPKRFTFSFIGFNAVYYILLISLVFFVYEYYKYKTQFNKTIFYFFLIFVFFQIISLFHGLIIYPYYDSIDISQLTKLKYLNDKFNISLENNIIIAVWLLFRESKNIILSSFCFCFIPLLFIHLFSNDEKRVVPFIEEAVLFLVCLFCLYSIPEVLYLKFDNQIAKHILETINPFLYDVVSAHGWWPPILWDKNGGQLRSLCQEPSFFCVIAAFCIPFLVNYIYKNFSLKNILLFTFFIFMLFMSKSRTGMVLFLIEIIMIFSLFLYDFNKKKLCFILTLLFCIFFSAFININIPNKINKQKEQETFKNYIDNNLMSTIKLDSRSNKARLSNAIAMTKVGLSNPVLGVGKGLKDVYIVENIPEFAKKDKETNIWITKFKEKGFKSTFPVLNHYAYVFAENGIIGLIIFILPILYVFYMICKNKFLLRNFDFMIMIIAFIGQLFSMLGQTYFMTYPVSLGLVFLYINGITNKKNESINNVKH